MLKRHGGPASGFTLVELVIVLLIVCVMVWIAFPAYQSYITNMRVIEAKNEIQEMSRIIHEQEVRTGVLADGLDDVVDTVTGKSMGWDGRRDPWGFAYEYKNLRTFSIKGKGNARQDKNLKPVNSDFDLYSVGPDGKTAPSLTDARSRDDVVRARDGGFIGTAAEFDP